MSNEREAADFQGEVGVTVSEAAQLGVSPSAAGMSDGLTFARLPIDQPSRDGDLPGERWRKVCEIAGMEEFVGYEVSDHGRVRSFWQAWHPYVEAKKLTGPRLLHLITSGGGYICVCMAGKFLKVHQMVAKAFIGPVPEKQEVRHRNDVPSDNRSANLLYGTHFENSMDVVENGRSKNFILSKSDVPSIWESIVAGKSNKEIADSLNLNASTIANISGGHTWSHLTKLLPGWPLNRPTNPDGKEPIFPRQEVIDSEVEIWKECDWLDGIRVSSWGKVQGCMTWDRRQLKHVKGEWYDLKCRQHNPDPSGLLFFHYMRKGVRQSIFVHQVVLKQFAGSAPEGYIAIHIDDHKQNNRADNLCWSTFQELVGHLSRTWPSFSERQGRKRLISARYDGHERGK